MYRRVNAEIHLLITITSFVLTVLLIRAYLYVTGFPQIGNGELHIAHMLWGGLALFSASTVLLLYRGLYIARLAAVLTGVGFGFFIDEIGKFLTRSNDYFFAPAAVIIYVIFLLFVGVYILWFRPRKGDVSLDDNEAFSDIRELLDGVAAGELTKRERLLLQRSIQRLIDDDEEEYRSLGVSVKQYVKSRPLTIKQQRLEAIGSIWPSVIRQIVSSRIFIFIFVALIGVDLIATFITIYHFQPISPSGNLFDIFDLNRDEMVRAGSLLVRLFFQTMLVLGAVAVLSGKVTLGRRLMVGALLPMIVIIDSIDFYFSQFSTAYTVAIDALLLIMVEARFGNEKTSQVKKK